MENLIKQIENILNNIEKSTDKNLSEINLALIKFAGIVGDYRHSYIASKTTYEILMSEAKEKNKAECKTISEAETKAFNTYTEEYNNYREYEALYSKSSLLLNQYNRYVDGIKSDRNIDKMIGEKINSLGEEYLG